MNLDQKTGEKLRILRKQKGYTTREVGSRIGVTNSYISKIENGRIPSLTTLKKLCELYDVEIATLFGKKADIPSEVNEPKLKWIALGEEMEGKDLDADQVREMVKLIRKLRGEE